MSGIARTVPGAVVVVLLAQVGASACSIPVFRYALERWPADPFRIEAALPGSLAEDDRAALGQLEDRAAGNGGSGNYTVERRPGATDAARVTIRAPRGDAILWQGTAAEAARVVDGGPSQRELVRRLLAGDAVVWLVVPGSDSSETERALALLETELPLVAADTPLPRGIGLPGSELLSDVPLEVRFSVLVADSAAADAALLRHTLAAHLSAEKTDHEDAALVAAVFGRGRVAHVMPAAALDATRSPPRRHSSAARVRARPSSSPRGSTSSSRHRGTSGSSAESHPRRRRVAPATARRAPCRFLPVSPPAEPADRPCAAASSSVVFCRRSCSRFWRC
ncbi:MAG: hypothetical protein ACKO35_07490 [Planctomycetaceae bacterium]